MYSLSRRNLNHMAVQQMSVNRRRQLTYQVYCRQGFIPVKFLPAGFIPRKVHRHRIHAAILQANAGQETHP